MNIGTENVDRAGSARPKAEDAGLHKFFNGLAKTSVGITAGALTLMLASMVAEFFTSGPIADIAWKTSLVSSMTAMFSGPFTGAALCHLFRDVPELISNYPKYMSSIDKSLTTALTACESMTGPKTAPPRP